jgi:hypothetical protein
MAQAGDLYGAAGASVGAAANGAAVVDGFDDFDLPENFLGDAVNNGPASAQNQGPQQPLDLETRIENALRRSEERLTLRFQNQLSTTVEDALSTSLAGKKRKADQIKNEGIKKQYISIEEATLRMKAVRSSLAEAVDEQTPWDLLMRRSLEIIWTKVSKSSRSAWLTLRLLSKRDGMSRGRWKTMSWSSPCLKRCVLN